MRKVLSGFISLVLLTVVISACSGGNNGSSPSNNGQANTPENTASEQPKDGGSLIIGVASDPVILNPNYAGDRVSLTIDQALYAPLYQVNDGKKTFYLADSLTLSDDNLTYTLKLKSGLTWHDGQPLTADDVVFTIDKILDEKQNSFLRGNLIIGGKPVQAVKVDDTTVEFKLPQVSPAFEATLLQVFPIPKHIFESEANIEKSPKNNTPVGSGAFKFKEYKTGEYVTLERFDNYFGGKPHLDSITYRIAKDTNAANLALQNGEINVKYLDPQDVATIQATNNFEISPYSEGRLAYLMFNQNSDTGVLGKKEVRQALAYALNRDEIIKVAYSSGEYADPAKSFVTPDGLFHTNDVTTFDNDAAKAKELLQAAGVNGLKLRFIVQSGNKAQEAVSLYVQQKLKEIGVEVELQSMDSSAWVKKFIDQKAKDYEIAMTGYIMGYDPDAYSILFKSTGSSNYSHYVNKEVDTLFEQGTGEADATKRDAIYKQLQEIIASDAAIYPIAYTKTIVAVDKKYGGLDQAVLKPVVIFEDLSKLYLK
ncbi:MULTISPECIES: ABC transporter substrate-binding protein [Bacillales]|uniref:ABC transporter substrate-binding protein n=1 Tax=Bacillales TaxID=1385 RepID=UPI0006A77BDF|nr:MULTISPECIES: ABC transporter substrate-binding protein [Bacillales]OBZ09255.1 peptide ABC transporter substrate-binding protein [Bacillus sp. FJAT-26390]